MGQGDLAAESATRKLAGVALEVNLRNQNSKKVTNNQHFHYPECIHRSDSIQGTDYIATAIQEFLGQKLKV